MTGARDGPGRAPPPALVPLALLVSVAAPGHVAEVGAIVADHMDIGAGSRVVSPRADVTLPSFSCTRMSHAWAGSVDWLYCACRLHQVGPSSTRRTEAGSRSNTRSPKGADSVLPSRRNAETARRSPSDEMVESG